MIPIRLVLADLKRLWVGSLVIVLLIGFATALGVTVTLQERALRLGSARAADRFDLVVGAAGSETQLVLSAVFLQPSPLPLMPGAILAKLAADPRVAWAAPIGFGDSFEGMPVVGTTTAFVTDGGRAALTEGRDFAAMGEAVVGAAVPLAMGDTVKPMHGLVGEAGHTHTELAYTVVGRMARTGTPWDRAILVPIEGVWAIHGLGHHHHEDADDDHHEGADADHDHEAEAGHDHEAEAAAAGSAHAHPDEHDADHDHDHEPAEGAHAEGHGALPVFDHIGPPWSADMPGVPAIIVKAASIADAYRLRGEYRGNGTVGVFPAEVLTRLYATLGDARLVLTLIAMGTEALVAAAVVLVTVVHLSQRRREIGALRALGAPRSSIFALVWCEILVLVGVGVALGFGLGYAAARVIASVMTSRSGIVLPVEFEPQDGMFALLLLAVAALIALVPAFLAYRQPAAAALRG